MGEWKQTSCYNCGVCCGLEVEIEDNQVVNVRPDKASMRSLGGYCCRKGRALKYFQHNKNRLDYPLKRVGDEFIRISWDQALSEIGEKVREIRAKYSPKAFGTYGVGLAVDHVAMYPLHDLNRMLGSQWVFNPLSVEFVSPWWAFGKFFGSQFPMLEGETTAEVYICWGANTYVAHNVGNARTAIREISNDPDRMFICVDPCLSETARMADLHIMPKNGTDALLARALVALILENGWQDQEFLDTYTSGWEKGRKWFEGFDIDQAFEVCGVSRDQMETFAKILCTRPWGVHMDLGIFFGRHATLAAYLITMLAAVTGNMFKTGTNIISDCYQTWGNYTDENTEGAWRTWKTNSFPTISTYNGGALQECMEDPDEMNRLRCLFVEAGNPVRSWPDSNTLEKEMKNLDLLVVIDIAMSETARCADYVLPGTTGYERFGTTIFPGGYPFSTLTFKQQLLTPLAERRDDSAILVDIMDAVGLLPEIPESLYEIAQKAVETNDRMLIIAPVKQYLSEIGREDCFMQVLYKTMGKAFGSVSKAVFWAQFVFGLLPMENAMRVGYTFPHLHPELESDPQMMAPVIRDQVFGVIDISPSGNVIACCEGTIEGQIKDHVTYADRKIHVFDETVDKFIHLITPEEERKELERTAEYPYLISAGTHSEDGVNTIMRNPGSFQYRQPYVLRMHPEDAAQMNLSDGQWVKVTTESGSIKVPVQYSYYSARGYGNIPHHFGLKEGEKAYGDGVNKLTSAKNIDEIAGDAIYRYVPCRIDALEEGEEYGLWND